MGATEPPGLRARGPFGCNTKQLHPGDICPECGVGKVYRQKEPKTLVRIVGRPPLEATRYEMERLRCNGCGEVYTADEPAEAGAEKYDETAAAMIAQLRYGSGVPFKRLERLEGNLGIPLPAATQWGIAEKAALGLGPAYDEFIRQAALGEVMHNDDTGMRILRLAREPADPRTGIFTSGIVSLGPGWKIALYFSGAKHAGENLAELLKRRPPGLAPLIQMCDALSWNTSHLPEGVERLLAHCMSHGRRQFVEVAENFPEECRYVLETLGGIWHHDALARKQELSPEERLRFHQEHSGPLMKTLHDWMEAQLAERKTEPNSGLGKAIRYMLRHWMPLTLFLREPGAPIDNNLVERILKKAILAPEKLTVLQDAEWRQSRRSVHESDPYLRTERSQSVRLSDRVAAARRGVEAEPIGVDALELPRDTGAAGNARRRVI